MNKIIVIIALFLVNTINAQELTW
ncbi:MAG: hypothetical protein RI943_1068, partial [Bacteroidota bacterium]